MEAELMLTGNWTNFEELEDTLTLEELQAMLIAARKREHRANQFAAGLKGVDIGGFDDNSERETVEEVYHRAQVKAAAKLAGMEPEEFELRSIGFGID